MAIMQQPMWMAPPGIAGRDADNFRSEPQRPAPVAKNGYSVAMGNAGAAKLGDPLHIQLAPPASYRGRHGFQLPADNEGAMLAHGMANKLLADDGYDEFNSRMEYERRRMEQIFGGSDPAGLPGQAPRAPVSQSGRQPQYPMNAWDDALPYLHGMNNGMTAHDYNQSPQQGWDSPMIETEKWLAGRSLNDIGEPNQSSQTDGQQMGHRHVQQQLLMQHRARGQHQPPQGPKQRQQQMHHPLPAGRDPGDPAIFEELESAMRSLRQVQEWNNSKEYQQRQQLQQLQQRQQQQQQRQKQQQHLQHEQVSVNQQHQQLQTGFDDAFVPRQGLQQSLQMNSLGRARQACPAVLPAWEDVLTLMVRNVPVKYTQDMLLEEWPHHDSYDFLYLPICIDRKRNTSFAFVNFVSTEAAFAFYVRWHKKRLEHFHSRKPIDISPAVVQGRDANLVQIFRNKTFRIRNSHFQPAIFENNKRVSMPELFNSPAMLRSGPLPGQQGGPVPLHELSL
jgi:hypothetical protein